MTATTTNRKGKPVEEESSVKWGTVGYLRQLSTVVIGILITFGGSALIKMGADRKEAGEVLTMVRVELEKNLARATAQRDRLVHEMDGARAMKPFIHSPEAIPGDSLTKYLDVITDTQTADYLTNSFEMLKTSHLRSVRNRELLRDLYTVYENAQHFEAGVRAYNSLKVRGLGDYFAQLDSDLFDALLTIDPRARHAIFADMMRSPVMRNYIVSAADENYKNLIPDADRLIAEISSAIGMIDREVKPRK
jgi:hypothetical protein